MHISLEFNVRKFTRQKFRNEYHDAKMTFTHSDGSRVVKNIRLRSRGDFRKRHCHFPPVKLDFRKTPFESTSMNDVKSLKLVTHCRGNEEYQQYILKEYLVYRMFNILTENSYRVRLFEIEYIDSEGKMDPLSKYGFIIESDLHLGSRIQAIRIDRNGIPAWLTDTHQTNLMIFFQFMIGNTDWAIRNQHNIRLFKLMDPAAVNPLVIPYDFDYAGMVNTYYALPDESLPISSVRERVYRGYCLSSEEEYRDYARIFIDHKEELYSLVGNCRLLESRHKKEMLEYLDEFFNVIENPRLLRMEIINKCRELPAH
jgi:hypothetical protein